MGKNYSWTSYFRVQYLGYQAFDPQLPPIQAKRTGLSLINIASDNAAVFWSEVSASQSQISSNTISYIFFLYISGTLFDMYYNTYIYIINYNTYIYILSYIHIIIHIYIIIQKYFNTYIYIHIIIHLYIYVFIILYIYNVSVCIIITVIIICIYICNIYICLWIWELPWVRLSYATLLWYAAPRWLRSARLQEFSEQNRPGQTMPNDRPSLINDGFKWV